MALLDENISNQVIEALQPITKPVELVVLTGSGLVINGRDEPGQEKLTTDLLNELAALNENITVKTMSVSAFPGGSELGITLTPTILLREAGSERTNIRFSGMPSGYEFQTLLETLLMLGTGESQLSDSTVAKIDQVSTPTTLLSFVTPTCPHCPRAVITGFRFAFHNPNIVATGIEATEFPLITQQYRISGVPDTLISGSSEERVLGGQPEQVFVEATLKAAGVDSAGAAA